MFYGHQGPLNEYGSIKKTPRSHSAVSRFRLSLVSMKLGHCNALWILCQT